MEPEETWNLHLDRYERDNLLMLLQVIMSSEVKPLDILNTGDWVGQIRWKLSRRSGIDDTKEKLCSNISVESLKERIGWWLEREKKSENDVLKDLVNK